MELKNFGAFHSLCKVSANLPKIGEIIQACWGVVKCVTQSLDDNWKLFVRRSLIINVALLTSMAPNPSSALH